MSGSLEVDDLEVIGVMRDGARRIVEYAEGRWYGGAYGTDEAMRQQMLAHWRAIDHRVGELCTRLREAARRGEL